jgi:hypothetical protein
MRRRGALGAVVIPWVWGDAAHPLPAGTTINYGNLFQLHQQARAAGDVAEADRSAADINRITSVGPITGGGVPYTDLVPTGPGTVYSGQDLLDIQHADLVYQGIRAGGFITLGDLQTKGFILKYVPLAVILQGIQQWPTSQANKDAAIAWLTGQPAATPGGTIPTPPKPPKPGTPGPTTPAPGDPGGPPTGGPGSPTLPTPPKAPKPGTGQPSPVTPVLAGLSLNAWGAIVGGVVLLVVLSGD